MKSNGRAVTFPAMLRNAGYNEVGKGRWAYRGRTVTTQWLKGVLGW